MMQNLSYHMRRLVAADLLPERTGQPAKVWAHISLADLMMLDGSSALQQEWTARVRAQWAAHRVQALAGGSDGGAWLDGDAAEAIACDAAMAPIVTGEVNPAALEELVRLCVDLDRLRHHGATATSSGSGSAAGGGRDAPGEDTTRAWDALEQAIIGKTMIVLLHSRLLLDLQRPLLSVRTCAMVDSWHVQDLDCRSSRPCLVCAYKHVPCTSDGCRKEM